MKYQRFEWLVIGVGAAAVLGTLTLALTLRVTDMQYAVTEIVAEIVLLGVLIGAVHWGRKGGLIAALAATVIYIAMRMPSLLAGSATTENLQLIAMHVAVYGLVGIVGGEVCSRIKYFFVRLEDAFNIDESSKVYNQRFAGQILRMQIGQHVRYGTIFSCALITLSPRLTADLRPAKVTALIRTAANHIRDDVRLVDEVGRLDDGRFLVLFPQTAKDGGTVAGDRVCRGVRNVLGAKDESVTCVVYGVPEDVDAISALADSLGGEAAPRQASGE